MTDTVIDEFTRGVDDYWSGEVPALWNDPRTRAMSPYLTGWYMASLWEVEVGSLLDEDGDPLQDEEN